MHTIPACVFKDRRSEGTICRYQYNQRRTTKQQLAASSSESGLLTNRAKKLLSSPMALADSSMQYGIECTGVGRLMQKSLGRMVGVCSCAIRASCENSNRPMLGSLGVGVTCACEDAPATAAPAGVFDGVALAVLLASPYGCTRDLGAGPTELYMATRALLEL